jgi:hypothetical protein
MSEDRLSDSTEEQTGEVPSEDQSPDACDEHPDGCPTPEPIPDEEYATELPENVNWDVIEGIRYCPCGCPVVVLFGAASEVRGLVPFTLDQQPTCPFCYNFDLFGLPEQYDVEKMKSVSRDRAIELAGKLREKNILYRRVSAAPPQPKSQLVMPSIRTPTDLTKGLK